LPLHPKAQVEVAPETQVPEALHLSASFRVVTVHVWPVPQVVPEGLLLTFTQVEVPVLHEVCPFSQLLPVLQVTPGVQLLHEPL
jgi:hypothetical protein